MSIGTRPMIAAAMCGLLVAGCSTGDVPAETPGVTDAATPEPAAPAPVNVFDLVWCDVLPPEKLDELSMDLRFGGEPSISPSSCQFIDRRTLATVAVGAGTLGNTDDPGADIRPVEVRGYEGFEARFTITSGAGIYSCCGSQVDLGSGQTIFVHAERSKNGSSDEEVLDGVVSLMDALVAEVGT